MVLRSPLHHVHESLGARFTEFAGFEMPVQYSSIRDEHINVRRYVGLFDVSHMSNIWLTGEDVVDLLSLSTVTDASKIKPNQGQYTVILNDDGAIIDDIIFMNLVDRYMIIPNAGMSTVVANWLTRQAKKHKLSVKVEDVSRIFVILAVQGPKSKDALQGIVDVDLNNVPFFNCCYANVDGTPCIISHTGYTGELGFELQITPPERAERVYRGILEAGKEYNIKPIGLGARDTLRLEKCFMLAGNEFAGGRTPLEAGLDWVINWDHEFIGKEALIKQREKGDYDRLTCLLCVDKGIPRHGCEIMKNDKKIGVVTSGTLSPCLNTGIAMGYVKHGYKVEGDLLDIVIRDKLVKAKVIKPPFVKKDWAKMNP
ncbi:MAG: glycine cleavage system aminomethyltransferase GcvT [Candidatus Thermoplasmatota archaeon]